MRTATADCVDNLAQSLGSTTCCVFALRLRGTCDFVVFYACVVTIRPPSTAKSVSTGDEDPNLQLDCKGESTKSPVQPSGCIKEGPRAFKPRQSSIRSTGNGSALLFPVSSLSKWYFHFITTCVSEDQSGDISALNFHTSFTTVTNIHLNFIHSWLQGNVKYIIILLCILELLLTIRKTNNTSRYYLHRFSAT